MNSLDYFTEVRLESSSENLIVSKSDVSVVDLSQLAEGHPALKFMVPPPPLLPSLWLSFASVSLFLILFIQMKEKKDRDRERDEREERDSVAYNKKDKKDHKKSSKSSSSDHIHYIVFLFLFFFFLFLFFLFLFFFFWLPPHPPLGAGFVRASWCEWWAKVFTMESITTRKWEYTTWLDETNVRFSLTMAN